ncbi:MAG TPA: transaldolase family protein [Clostridia bacterium]|nr:transaldolase family protein [Clostridia bacterium]
MSNNSSFCRLNCTLGSLLGTAGNEGNARIVSSDEDYVGRVLNKPLELDEFTILRNFVQYIGVTGNFKEIIDFFKTPEGETPAGFRVEYVLAGNILNADLVRDISYDKNGVKRPTNLLFSADSANPYEVAPVSNLISNLTCNPGIIYDLFINNPKANIGNKYKTRDEVMEEIGRILGPGADISVELNNPFSASEREILEEAARFKEMLSKYRVVIKVPHTGPVNKNNVGELLNGDKKFQRRYSDGTTEDMFRGHNLALMLHEHGYRVNFTLMFEPYQTALALQAKPYFINSFIRHRGMQTHMITGLLKAYDASGETAFLKQLRSYMIDTDYLSPKDADIDFFKVKETAELFVEQRKADTVEGSDGLDGVRHNLRWLRQANLPDTRLIICSMEGERNYPDIDRLLTEEEFRDMVGKVVITAEPGYLARFTSTPQVVAYQRRFMNAANGQK